MFKQKTGQDGIAHLLLIVVVLVVVGVVGIAAYSVATTNKSSKSSSSTAASAPATGNPCAAELHDSDLCKFFSHYDLDTLSYSAVIHGSGTKANSSTTLQVDGQGNSSMVVAVGGAEQTSFVKLGNASYIKGPNETSWTRFTGATSDLIKVNPTDDIKLDTKHPTGKNNTITYKKLGKEACGNLTCLKYQVVDTSQPSVQQFLWIDNKDYLLQKWSSKDATSAIDMVFTYQAVTITAPSPAHDLSAR